MQNPTYRKTHLNRHMEDKEGERNALCALAIRPFVFYITVTGREMWVVCVVFVATPVQP